MQRLLKLASLAMLAIATPAMAQNNSPQSDTVDVTASIVDPRGAITVSAGQYDFGTIERSASGNFCFIRAGSDGSVIASNASNFDSLPLAGECEAVGTSITPYNFSCVGDFEIAIGISVSQPTRTTGMPLLYVYESSASPLGASSTGWRQTCSEFSASQSVGQGLPVLVIGPDGPDFSGTIGTLTIEVEYP